MPTSTLLVALVVAAAVGAAWGYFYSLCALWDAGDGGDDRRRRRACKVFFGGMPAGYLALAALNSAGSWGGLWDLLLGMAFLAGMLWVIFRVARPSV